MVLMIPSLSNFNSYMRISLKSAAGVFRSLANAGRIMGQDIFLEMGNTFPDPEKFKQVIESRVFQKNAATDFPGYPDAEGALGQVLEKFLNVISSGLDLPAGKIYVCSKCGFLAEEDEPAGCAACGAVKEELRIFKLS